MLMYGAESRSIKYERDEFPYKYAVTSCYINGRTPLVHTCSDISKTASGPPIRHYSFQETKCKRKDAEGDVYPRFADEDDGRNKLSEKVAELD
jgi:hypothetical protein